MYPLWKILWTLKQSNVWHIITYQISFSSLLHNHKLHCEIYLPCFDFFLLKPGKINYVTIFKIVHQKEEHCFLIQNEREIKNETAAADESIMMLMTIKMRTLLTGEIIKRHWGEEGKNVLILQRHLIYKIDNQPILVIFIFCKPLVGWYITTFGLLSLKAFYIIMSHVICYYNHRQ